MPKEMECQKGLIKLLNMLGTLEEDHKANLRAHFPTMVHAYKSTSNDSTGFTPRHLMFGHHPHF